MADMPANVGITRKMSFGINGKLNGVESKTPFLIGVSGGTASGKVIRITRGINLQRAIKTADQLSKEAGITFRDSQRFFANWFFILSFYIIWHSVIE